MKLLEGSYSLAHFLENCKKAKIEVIWRKRASAFYSKFSLVDLCGDPFRGGPVVKLVLALKYSLLTGGCR